MKELMSLHVVTSEEYKNANKEEKTSNKLYFLSDTKEIYKGTESYTNSIVLYTGSEPDIKSEGKLYINSDTLEGKIYNGSKWITVIIPFENVFNVKKYGATGDGVTDDGAAIQDALNACNNAGGGTVYFPIGTYCISKTVFYYSNQKLEFENGTILKRIKNAANNNYTCGCFLCNWFETSDTTSNTIACENAEITGCIFDMGGDIGVTLPTTGAKTGVAPINTCHADGVYINNCKFINNYTAHCIEINSSDNVYVEKCSFSDYVGTSDTYRYNEMIQIDKAVNAALGGKYDSSSVAVLKGYYKDTQISASSPDCKGSSNINISECVFETHSLVVAIGNHHESSYTTVNKNIHIHDNVFKGGTGSRGYIHFDAHTVDVDVYDNYFVNGSCGVTALASNANFSVHDNRFESCVTIVSGDIYEYHNLIDGEFNESGSEASNINSEVSNIIGDIDALSIYVDGLTLNSNFSWVYQGGTTSSTEHEYNNENIVQFRGIGLQLFQMCISLNTAINDTDWHEVGILKSGCRLSGNSPFTFSAPCSDGQTVRIAVIPENHPNSVICNKVRMIVSSGLLSSGTFVYISRLLPCNSYTDNISEISNGFTLNSSPFSYRLEGEYSNSTVYHFKNSPFQYLQICAASSEELSKGKWYTLGTLSNDCKFAGSSPFTFFAKTGNGINLQCTIIPSEYADDSSECNTVRIKPVDGNILSGDYIYICTCLDRDDGNEYYKTIEDVVKPSANFNFGLTNEYSNANIFKFKDTQLQKLNLVFEQESSVTLSKDTWYDLASLENGCRLKGFSPFSVIAHSNGGVPMIVEILPDEHYSSIMRNKIRIKPLADISYDSSSSYMHRITLSLILPSNGIVNAVISALSLWTGGSY